MNDLQMHFQALLNGYEALVKEKHPEQLSRWPLLNGKIDVKSGNYNQCHIHIYKLYFLAAFSK